VFTAAQYAIDNDFGPVVSMSYGGCEQDNQAVLSFGESPVAGAAITTAIARVWDQQVYQATDLPWMIATVAGFLVVLTLLACLVPLRKALAVDPLTALRSDTCISPQFASTSIPRFTSRLGNK